MAQAVLSLRRHPVGDQHGDRVGIGLRFGSHGLGEAKSFAVLSSRESTDPQAEERFDPVLRLAGLLRQFESAPKGPPRHVVRATRLSREGAESDMEPKFYQGLRRFEGRD